MKIALRSNGPTRFWHRRLAERLMAMGHELVLDRSRGEPLRLRTKLVLRVEQLIYGARAELFASPDAACVSGSLDAAGGKAGLLMEVLFDGKAGEGALVDALLRCRVPTIAIQGFVDRSWTDLAIGLPAAEEPEILARSLDQVLVRLIGLCLQAVRYHETGDIVPRAVSDTIPTHVTGSVVGFLAKGLRKKLGRRFGSTRGRPDHWQIALRRVTSGEITPWTSEAFVTVPDDGLRFQADPFVIEHEGRAHLFFEDFPYATRKGVIAHIAVAESGGTSMPRTVLEQPFHLSYPLILPYADAIYMLPEMSAARRIQLYRADPFPDRWIADRVLVDDVVAGDATPIWHEGRYWIFATLAGDGGSSWDQLGLFHAPDLFGPWEAHRANPVLIDAGAARPAGAMWHEDGVLMRVAQDCRTGYGVGLAICRVDRLDLDGYAQTIVERRGPPLGSIGIHTLNRAGSFEMIDLKRSHR